MIHAPWGWDDIIVAVALAFQLIMAGIGIGKSFDPRRAFVHLLWLMSMITSGAVKQGGMGYHILYLEETNPGILITWGKYLTAISTLYFFIVNIPKLAILALYHRVFPGHRTHTAIYILSAILIAASLANTIAALAACQPYAANWDMKIPGAKCINKEALFIWSSIPNIVTDVAMLILPLPIVWKLHTNKRMKAGLTVTLLVGSIGLITSILRFNGFFQNNSFTDGTYAGVELMIWTQTEPGVYLICACLPTFRPLLEKVGIGKLTAAVKGQTAAKTKTTYSRQLYGKSSKLGTMDDEIALNGFGRSGTTEVKGGFRELKEDSVTSQEGITVRTQIQMQSDSV
jgi:hypothetical protein